MMIQIPLKKGDKSKDIKLIQEWLCLQDIKISIDGDFGNITEIAIKQFQKTNGLDINGIIDSETFNLLTKPLEYATTYVPTSLTLKNAIVEIAKIHLSVHPKEVGGQNMGPWVRYYTKGHEGEPWAWCAGFVSSIVEQACKGLKIPMPFKFTLSCDELAIQAKKNNTFIYEFNAFKQILPGDIFLNRKTTTDWVHTGIIIGCHKDYIDTIEGNTNDEGSREGYEVCQRKRAWNGRDYIMVI